jgi:D-alanyl-D-alanine carboxypeptidase
MVDVLTTRSAICPEESVIHRLLVVAAALTMAVAQVHAQAARTAETARDTVDRIVETLMASQHIPGLGLAVVRAGKVIKAQGYGMADLEHQIPVTPQTVFKIGSVSKQFLATGIMLLVQDGRLSLDDPISRFYPGAPESWRGITVRHFLTHTSGVLREGPAFDPLKVQHDSLVIRSAFDRPLEFAIGSKYQYCNVCYFTLADIIARVSGKAWDVFLDERVFRPMGMTATRTTTTTALVPHRARGYAWRDNAYVNAAEFLALRPSGAFLSTVLDLAKWDAALYEERVLTKTSRTAMWSPVRLTDGSTYGYGFGWTVDSLDGHWRVHHGGSLPGFRAMMMRFPNDNLTVIVLTNGDGANPMLIARDVARIYLANPRRMGAAPYRARSPLPANPPVGVPSATAARPFTKTQRIPVESFSGSTYVASSRIVRGSNTITSAKKPSLMSPRSGIR